ncbi:hypothetical protein D3C79_808050 [compost metagenome]
MRRLAGIKGHHQILRQVSGELAEHHSTERAAEGEADQSAILEQLPAHAEKASLRAAVQACWCRALAPASVAQAHGQAEQRRHQKWQVIVEHDQRYTKKRPDGIGDVAQGVLDREDLGTFLQPQQRTEPGLGGNIDHCQGQVDQHQAGKEQAEFAADHCADKGHGKHQGRGDDHGIAAQGIDQVAAI